MDECTYFSLFKLSGYYKNKPGLGYSGLGRKSKSTDGKIGNLKIHLE
jgi:hypothetical protein